MRFLKKIVFVSLLKPKIKIALNSHKRKKQQMFYNILVTWYRKYYFRPTLVEHCLEKHIFTGYSWISADLPTTKVLKQY